MLAGYFKRLDGPLMRLTDLFLALPLLPLLLVIIMLFRDPLRAAFGPEGGIFILIVVRDRHHLAGCRPPGSCAATFWR